MKGALSMLNLFNSVTDAIEILTEAQKKAEETYINSSETDKEILESSANKNNN